MKTDQTEASSPTNLAGEPKPEPIKDNHPTPEERAATGKAARSKTPREMHAAWDPTGNRPDPVDLLESQAATRIPELVPIRYGRMLVSPFAFYRGAAVIMTSDLASMQNTGLNVQLCGDAHLANFGGFASPERELILVINDFDETLPGPWEWDVKRLAASIEVAGRERGFNTKTRRSLVLAAVGEYHRAMREFSQMKNLDLWYLHMNQAEMQARWGLSVKRKIMKGLEAEFTQAYHRDNRRALENLTTRINSQLRIAANPPLVVPFEDLLSEADQDQLEETMLNLIRSYRSTLQPDRRYLLENFQYVQLPERSSVLAALVRAPGFCSYWGVMTEIPIFYRPRRPRPRY